MPRGLMIVRRLTANKSRKVVSRYMNGYPNFNDWRATRVIGSGKLGQTFEVVRSDGFGSGRPISAS